MRFVQILLMTAVVGSIAGCGGRALTRAGERGHWAVTRYLVRVYEVDQNTAFEAGKKYFQQKGYTITNQIPPKLLHDNTRGRSLIIRTKNRGKLTQVEMKVGPAYDVDQTNGMMDEYQALLPEAAQPK